MPQHTGTSCSNGLGDRRGAAIRTGFLLVEWSCSEGGAFPPARLACQAAGLTAPAGSCRVIVSGPFVARSLLESATAGRPASDRDSRTRGCRPPRTRKLSVAYPQGKLSRQHDGNFREVCGVFSRTILLLGSGAAFSHLPQTLVISGMPGLFCLTFHPW